MFNSAPKFRMIFVLSLLLANQLASAQFDWKLQKNKEGIKVYTSSSPNSSFKSVRVECTLNGTYAKLISILSDVEGFEDWIYNNKMSKLIKKNSAHDFIYYSLTKMPWPLSDRDVILRMTMQTDSLPRVLRIQGKNVENVLPKFEFRERIPQFAASWEVTMPSANQIHIIYILSLDPGGSISPGIANMFIDKGPFETFSNLSKELQK